MSPEHLPRTCKWATPTLFLQWPLWTDAWSWEWSCHRNGAFNPVKSPDHCRTCPAWEDKTSDNISTPPHDECHSPAPRKRCIQGRSCGNVNENPKEPRAAEPPVSEVLTGQSLRHQGAVAKW